MSGEHITAALPVEYPGELDGWMACIQGVRRQKEKQVFACLHNTKVVAKQKASLWRDSKHHNEEESRTQIRDRLKILDSI